MPEKPSRDIVIPLLFGAFLIIATCLAGWLGSAEKLELPGSVTAAPALAAAPDVEVVGGIAQPRIELGKPVRFWLTVRNRSTTPIGNLSLEPSGLGKFQISARCWRPQQGLASCIPAAQAVAVSGAAGTAGAASSPDVFASSLARCQTLSVWGELTGSGHQDRQTLFVTVRWSSPDKHASQYVVALGGVEARDDFDKHKETWAAIVAFYKDLGLPFLLVVLAYVFKRWDDQRERKRQDAESERQQLLQTWNKMLPVSHRDSTKYNMPLASAIGSSHECFLKCRRAMDQTPGSLPADSDLVKHALYYLLLVMRRFRSISDERGGFYFKDRTGEKISAQCVLEMFGLYLREVKDLGTNTSVVLDNIKPSVTLGQFVPVLDASLVGQGTGTPLLQALYQVHSEFYKWIPTKEFLDIVALLEAFSLILDFEMNRPYLYWYSQKQREILKLDDGVKKTLEDLALKAQKMGAKYKNLPQELREYFKDSQKV